MSDDREPTTVDQVLALLDEIERTLADVRALATTMRNGDHE